jgi:hypothetical protein
MIGHNALTSRGTLGEQEFGNSGRELETGAAARWACRSKNRYCSGSYLVSPPGLEPGTP